MRRFPDTDRVPQIGWNEVRVTRAHPLVGRLARATRYCYFVNSFHAVPDRPPTRCSPPPSTACAFCSMVAAGNIAATQFHAEKSGEIGLARAARTSPTWDGAPC